MSIDSTSQSYMENLIEQYRYPDGINGKKKSFNQVYEEMKKNGVLPNTITNANSLAKIWERKLKNKSSSNSYYWLMGYLEPVINKVKIDTHAKFTLFWMGLDRERKNEFFRTIESMLRFRGVSNNNIYDEIVRFFTERNLLDIETINWYIKEDYKRKNKTVNVKTTEDIPLMLELKKFGITSITEFVYEWRYLDKDKKYALMNNLAKEVLKYGIPMHEISTYLGKLFESNNIMSKYIVRKYLTIEFKDKERSDRKLGKTFESKIFETKENQDEKMNNETFETISELRNDGKKWDEIYNDYTGFKLQFKSISVMKTAFTREQARRRTS